MAIDGGGDDGNGRCCASLSHGSIARRDFHTHTQTCPPPQRHAHPRACIKCTSMRAAVSVVL